MKRGMILAAVMLLVALGALTSVGVLFRSSAEQFTVSASGRSARARAMARSGLAGLVREFETQRMEVLRGDQPVLLEELTLEQADGRTGVARIVRVRNMAAVAESAKINVNHADEATLGRLAMVGPDLASRIVAGRPYGAIDELLRVNGVTPELLYGDLRLLFTDAEEADALAVSVESGAVSGAVGLRDVLTVHGFWPPIQLGAGGNGASFAGEKKINLNRAWSEELGQAITKRYSADVAEGVKGIMSRGTTFKGERDIINVLRQIGVEPSDWVETLDSFCASDEPALPGRVDIARASEQVLAALPGLDETSASAIRSACETLDPDSLMSVMWPVTSGAISEQQLASCVDSIAPSSAQWRVVIEAGFLPAGQSEDEEAPLEHRVVLEAVIDLSSPRARVSELTDVTHLALAAAWRIEGADETDEGGAPEPEGEALDEGGTLGGVATDRDDDEDAGMDDEDRNFTGDDAGPGTPQPAPDHRIGRFRSGRAIRGGGA